MILKLIKNKVITHLLALLIGGFGAYYITISASIKTNHATNKALMPAVITAVEKHSSNTSNNTSNNLDIGKIKNKKNDSLKITFNNTQRPSLEQIKTTTCKEIKPIEYYEGLEIGDLTLLKTIRLTRKQRKSIHKNK